MRKLSELIQICMPFHFCWGGQYLGMCTAAVAAWDSDLISREERIAVTSHCSVLAKQHGPHNYLKNSILEKLGLKLCSAKAYPPEAVLEIRTIYENEIKALKHQGN